LPSNTVLTTDQARPAEAILPAKAAGEKAGGRSLTIDAFRGFIMILLVSEAFGLSALKSHPGWSWLVSQLDHTEWEGCTLWDLIQPGFTFIVGAAMPFAFARRAARGDRFGKLFRHVAWRALMLIVLSNILSNFNDNKPTLQLINVLCQIAFGYLICFLILQLRFRYQVVAAALLVAGYWGLFVLFPGPDGPFSKTGNIGAVIDRAVLGYNYSGHYTTINFLGNAVTILFGAWTGMLLQSGKTYSYKIRLMAAAAAAGFLAGLALEPFNPMVKRLWTGSFAFFSTGWVILALLVFFWIIEVKQWRRWTFPGVVVGMNCIFIYSFWQVLSGWLNHGIGVFTGHFWFLGDLGLIPQRILVLAAMWYLCYWLYRRKIFFRI
jgi:heparan-alpha-glucosaminide N-acetyltransferase